MSDDSNQVVFVIDGENFSTTKEFFNEIERVMRVTDWGRNLDAFNDVLRGGFGDIPMSTNYTIVWRNSQVSRKRLGHEYRLYQLQQRKQTAHESWHDQIDQEIEQVKQGKGTTTFDELVEIIKRHGTVTLQLQ
jgi:RNAse (barnase) inhibitor barstar